MKSAFSLDDKLLIGFCAVIDAAAFYTLAYGEHTVQKCGGAWVLGHLEMIAVFSIGIIPLIIAVAAIVAAILMPVLRKPGLWVLSAVLLVPITAGYIVDAHERFPVPSDPVACSI
jgi:hypothetical protein